ncbi:hypothetical protein BEL04_20980 [Mucilaginibacter sp. PPCGB 2223]|uniref:hypothetical protein n=1 Tax=Mucilaginibacter sp. PPCGB 2223 TaxID=1886027 RepID=UPI00082682D5|nr:hypothetical protein [Mucilaginibacter sp. PPCGB 2223]OCX51182.1 hypothetical protein BEL04_20980 [Mucilaginibacter sp. PPCGB 2223]
MKGWITVTVPDNGQDVTTLVNIHNITHIKNLKDFLTISGSGKSRIYLNTSTDATQRYLPCHETFEMLMALISEAS